MGETGHSDPPLSDEFLTTEVTAITEVKQLRQRMSLYRQSQPFLTVMEGDDVGRMYQLSEGETIIGRSTKADIRLDDESISRRHIKLRIFGRTAVVEDLGSSNGTSLNGTRISAAPLRNGDKLLIGDRTVIRFSYHDDLDQNFQEQMYQAALRDPLTRAYNKRFLLDQLETEISYAKRHRTSLCLLMIDVDHFKRVNDRYGHLTGDLVLQRLAAISTELMRTEDVFARYGGEEFVVICRGIDLGGAAILAERLRSAVERSELSSTDGEPLSVTVSIGVALWEEEQSSQQFIETADSAMYRAKRGGRNVVMVS